MEIGTFTRTFLMIFLAEMGDKSQLLMVALAAEYRIRDILAGVTLSLFALNLLAVTLGGVIGELLPVAAVSLIAGLAFLAFAMVSAAEGEKDGSAVRHGKHTITTVFGTYFLAELGDKTQLTVLTVSAGEAGRIGGMLAVFCGAFAALLAADVLGLLVGALLGKKLPDGILRWISSAIFALCGTTRILEGAETLFSGTSHAKALAIALTVSAVLLSALICLKGRKKHERGEPGSKQPVPVQRYQ